MCEFCKNMTTDKLVNEKIVATIGMLKDPHPHFEVHYYDEFTQSDRCIIFGMAIYYCPRCGRKLEDT